MLPTSQTISITYILYILINYYFGIKWIDYFANKHYNEACRKEQHQIFIKIKIVITKSGKRRSLESNWTKPNKYKQQTWFIAPE